MVATRVFSGDSIATGDDMGESTTSWTKVLDDGDLAYDVNGLYHFSLWNNASSGSHPVANFLFRPSQLRASTSIAQHVQFGAGSDVHIKARRHNGIEMVRSGGDPDDNKWELVRIA